MVRRSALSLLLLGSSSFVSACSAPDSAQANDAVLSGWFADPLQDFPERLPPLPQAALGYEPAYPLWSDGGRKTRLVVLPNGASIDASSPDAYAFPVGALLLKTFAYRTPQSPNHELPVETRLLRHRADGWDYAAYAWDAAAKVAQRLELRQPEPRTILSDDDVEIEHWIPSRLECQQCHESSASAVLGINELQLGSSERGFSTLARRMEPAPKKPYRALPDAGPLTTAALGYLVGNCTHCHNGSRGAASSFDLRPDVALQNLIDEPTASSASADGIRVVPGNPEESVLFLGLRRAGELEVKDMPPLGVALRDDSGIELFRSWILALKDEASP